MPTFEYTNPAFTAGTPFLELLEPTLLLSLFAGRALGVMAWNRYLAHPHLLRFGFVSRRKKSGIRSHTLGGAAELRDVFLKTSLQ